MTSKYHLYKHFTDEKKPEEGDKHSYLYVVVSTFPKYFVFGVYKDEVKAKKNYYDFILGLNGVDKWCENNYDQFIGKECVSKEECKEKLREPDFHVKFFILM